MPMDLDADQYATCCKKLPEYRQLLERELTQFADLTDEQRGTITAPTRHMISHLEECIRDYETQHPPTEA